MLVSSVCALVIKHPAKRLVSHGAWVNCLRLLVDSWFGNLDWRFCADKADADRIGTTPQVTFHFPPAALVLTLRSCLSYPKLPPFVMHVPAGLK